MATLKIRPDGYLLSAILWGLTLAGWLGLALSSVLLRSDELVTLPIVLMVMLAAIALGCSLKRLPFPLLALALISFFPVGLYLLGAETLFWLVGVLNILNIVLALVLAARDIWPGPPKAPNPPRN